MILFSTKFIFVMFLFAAHVANAGAICTPFKVHPKVKLPPAPKGFDQAELSKNTEDLLIGQIGNIKTQSDFPRVYRSWLLTHSLEMTQSERIEWLQCIYYYVKMDTNKNGIPDWDAIIDQKPSRVLYPKDPDQDGDGIKNVLDADPLNVKMGIKTASDKIPAHLKIKRPEVTKLQDELFKEFKIIAIDHTDQHTPLVLEQLLSVLRNGFPKGFQLKSLNYVYAFSGHDPTRNIAAYHLKAQALSIGGVSAFSAASDLSALTAALIHEMGHAVLFEKVTAQELSAISVQFAGWSPIDSDTSSFYSVDFFKPYIFPTRKNIVSQYSMKNRHEWFAESFTASLINKLKRRGLFKKTGTSEINHSKYGIDYTNLTADFQQWFEHLIIQ